MPTKYEGGHRSGNYVRKTNRIYVINGKPGSVRTEPKKSIYEMTDEERQELIRMPEVAFLKRRLPGE